MRLIRRTIKQNNGFTLIELLIAIAIISILTVPLLNSFVFSGRITRDSRRAQNAQVASQNVVESIKHVTDLKEAETILKNVRNVSSFNKHLGGSSDELSADFVITGADSENFKVQMKLSPKSNFEYDVLDFADIYNRANVIYSELMNYDNSVVTLIKNMDIPYSEISVSKWDALGSAWVPYTPTVEQKEVRKTYGHLLADEYSYGAPGEFTSDVNSDLKKINIHKQVDISIKKNADKYEISFLNTFTYPYNKTDPAVTFEVIVKEEDPTAPVPGTYAFYKYEGVISLEIEEYSEYFDIRLPLYFLYAKAYASYLDTDGVTVITDPRKFERTEINITLDNVYITNAEGEVDVPLYLVEQADSIDDENFVINLKIDNSSLGTVSKAKVYTNEVLDLTNAGNGSLKLADSNTVTLIRSIYSDKDITNTANKVAYDVIDVETALYKISVEVYYDKNKDGSYTDDEVIYQAVTED